MSGTTWRDALPYMGRDAIIERMAVIYENSLADPLSKLMSGHTGMTWLEIFNVGHKALEKIGAEIASANTEAGAATAALRRSTITDGLANAEAEMLRAAQRKLARGIALDTPDQITGFVAYGRPVVGGPLKLVPPSHWEAGRIDWDTYRLVVAGEVDWFGLRIIDITLLDDGAMQRVLDDAGYAEAFQQSERSFGRRRKPGRPGEIDWDRADMAADQYIQRHGLPEQQARIVDLIMEWLTANDAGKAPNRRTVEKHVAKTYYGPA